MAFLLLCLLPLVGYLLTVRLLGRQPLVVTVAYTLFFALVAVPLTVGHVALIGSVRVTTWLVAGAVAVWLVALTPTLLKRIRGDLAGLTPDPTDREGGDRWGIAALGLVMVIGVAAMVHHNGTALSLALDSWFATGSAKCFYMLTFRLVEGLGDGAPLHAFPDAYDVATTPTNAVFTATLFPLLGGATFRVLFGLFHVLLALFVWLLVRRWTANPFAALFAVIFAVANPYALSVEVLDRNFIALTLSAVLLHTVVAFPTRAALAGCICGVVAGTGLRFLPLTFALPVLIIYRQQRLGWRRSAIFVAALIGCFAFNIPHMRFHAFHALGETQPLWTRIGAAITAPTRTPMVPYHNAFGPLLDGVSFIGALLGGVLVVGALLLVRDHRRRLLVLAVMALPTLLVIAVQRDWIEGDKGRIPLSVWLPVIALAGHGAAALVTVPSRWRALVALAGATLFVFAGTSALGMVRVPADAGTYERKPLYQRETPEFVGLLRRSTLPIGLLPGYDRLGPKLWWSAKRDTERASRDAVVRRHASRLENAGIDARPSADEQFVGRPGAFVDVRIELTGLAGVAGQNLGAAVVHRTISTASAADEQGLFVNLRRPEGLLDVYHKVVAVPWQVEPLAVTVLPLAPGAAHTHTIYVELNAFATVGHDADGFALVDVIQRANSGKSRLTAPLRALPQADDQPMITMRVPVGVRVVLRSWIVDLRTGSPHRIDAWIANEDPGSEASIRFVPREFESYL